MELTKRKQFELDIIYSLGDKARLEGALASAWASGLFSEEEMHVIVSDSKIYEDNKALEKLERFTVLSKKLGPVASFVLLNLIKQYPAAARNDAGYFYPNRRTIESNCKISRMQYVQILNHLAESKLIDKKIDKGISVSVDFAAIEGLCNGMRA